MARSVECRCDDSFTCGYCLRNAKPWLHSTTPASFSPPYRFGESEADYLKRICEVPAR